MIELIRNTKIDFMGKRKFMFLISGALVSLGIFGLVMIWSGHGNLGIDFAGGTEVQVKFNKMVPMNEARSALEATGLKGLQLQELPTVNKLIVMVKGRQEALGGISNTIISTLRGRFQADSPVVDLTTEVGPKVGNRLRKDAVVAILFATLGILAYITIRFQFRFSVGAAIATFHDVFAVLGVFYLMGKEVNLILISALLIIAGYSLTDTVVVFDRIRENMRSMLREPVEKIVNVSINEVLSRTAITSLTVLFSSLALLFFGGEVIHDFALAITLGVIVGTYSSWFVASPMVILIGGKTINRKR
ncbi:MAG: protein translocase subunit SecF [Nitrospiraceae bacterium]|nr:protein translocase subunit SecF [Nitrospiraceae bacterium]